MRMRRLLPISLAPTLCAAVLLPVAQTTHSPALTGIGYAAVVATSGAVSVLYRRYSAALTSVAECQEQWRTSWGNQVAGIRSAAGHLVGTRMPAAMSGAEVPPGLPGIDDGVASAFDHLVAAVQAAATGSREDQESVRLAAVALSRRVQASAHRIQESVSRLAEQLGDDPRVVEAAMQVDHAAAQQGRTAQSIAVLCGARPGQQWPDPLALTDVVRAAAGRITAYRRVEVTGDHALAVAPAVAEPLVHLVAELLANATQSSPPSTRVSVHVQPVQRGAVIQIDDGGVGMDAHALSRAREVVSGRREVGLADIGETVHTGLVVVGQYVTWYQFQVDLMDSPYGGVRAVVLVPSGLIETLDPVAAMPAHRPEPVSLQTAHAATSPPMPPASPPASLPQRRSRRGEAPAHAKPAAPQAPATPDQTPEQAGSWMAAFVNGSSSLEPDMRTASAAPENCTTKQDEDMER